MKSSTTTSHWLALTLLLSFGAHAQNGVHNSQKKTIGQKVDSLMKLMTLEEKIGQMNQYNGDWDATGPITKDGDKQRQISSRQLGSILIVTGVEHTPPPPERDI